MNPLTTPLITNKKQFKCHVCPIHFTTFLKLKEHYQKKDPTNKHKLIYNNFLSSSLFSDFFQKYVPTIEKDFCVSRNENKYTKTKLVQTINSKTSKSAVIFKPKGLDKNQEENRITRKNHKLYLCRHTIYPFICPAFIETTTHISENLEISKIWVQPNHAHIILPHESRVTKDTKNDIKEMLAKKIPVKEVLAKMKENKDPDKREARDYLMRKDIMYLYNKYNDTDNRRPDFEALFDSKNELIDKGLIKQLHYSFTEARRSGRLAINNNLNGDSVPSHFMFSWVDPDQLEFLKQYGNDSISAYSTFSITKYNIKLSVFFVLNNEQRGIPFLFVLCSSEASSELVKPLNNLKKLCESFNLILKPKIFCSDLAPNFFNAWVEVFGLNETKWIWCEYHFNNAIYGYLEQNISQMVIEKAKIISSLKKLEMTWDKFLFHQKLDDFVLLLESTPGCSKVKKYFLNNYYDKVQHWGLPYRIDSPLNVDMFAESFNNKFKGEYLNRKTNLRISSVFLLLTKYIQDLKFKIELSSEFTKCFKHASFRTKEHNKGHGALSIKIKKINIHKLDEFALKYNSSKLDREKFFTCGVFLQFEIANNKVEYTVLGRPGLCSISCKAKCFKCNICWHNVFCTCRDFLRKKLICEHIHHIDWRSIDIGSLGTEEVCPTQVDTFSSDYVLCNQNKSIKLNNELENNKKTFPTENSDIELNENGEKLDTMIELNKKSEIVIKEEIKDFEIKLSKKRKELEEIGDFNLDASILKNDIDSYISEKNSFSKFYTENGSSIKRQAELFEGKKKLISRFEKIFYYKRSVSARDTKGWTEKTMRVKRKK